jgi:hypothetical protein
VPEFDNKIFCVVKSNPDKPELTMKHSPRDIQSFADSEHIPINRWGLLQNTQKNS